MRSELQYIELYQEVSDLIKSRSCNVMNAVRDEAFEIFRRMGFPTRKVERYKYTDVDDAFAPNYGISLSPLTGPDTVADVSAFLQKCLIQVMADIHCP